MDRFCSLSIMPRILKIPECNSMRVLGQAKWYEKNLLRHAVKRIGINHGEIVKIRIYRFIAGLGTGSFEQVGLSGTLNSSTSSLTPRVKRVKKRM
ncbi:hypothetical protein RUM43_009328 [Polyplax serrata]|uniref:Uncharacterized protein n=1 Tax=Polyplax serrata TaxID=468196 RepID=A0AAN8S140_POLSC